MSAELVEACGSAREQNPERRVRTLLAGLVCLGVALRLLACVFDPPLHPDEYFQYLEPAWWHLTGVGQASWEWRDGVRSWVLPFYNGAWVALLRRLGVPAGAPIGWLVKAHWAAINASLVALAFRAGANVSRRMQRAQGLELISTSIFRPRDRGRASMSGSRARGRASTSGLRADPRASTGWEGGLLAAAACAAFPVLVSYAGHTLSELPSMLCMVAGLVLTAELLEGDDEASPESRRKARLVGILLSLGACLRIASGPMALVAPLWLLARRRYRLLRALLFASLWPLVVFGLVDLLTWGSFASSFVEYVKFNFIEGRSADYGTEPGAWYLRVLTERAPLALPLLLLPALVGLRANWPYLISALGTVAYLSAQPHKEERFIIAFWPFLLIAAAGTLGGYVARRRADAALDTSNAPQPAPNASTRAVLGQFAPLKGAAVWLLLVLFGGLGRLHGSEEWLEQADRLRGLAWAGAQADITGLIADIPYTGGAFWFGAPAPQFPFEAKLLSNPAITHALVVAGSNEEHEALAAGFQGIHRAGSYVVLRKRSERPD